jgi:tRNA pseudouridine65 synthase
MLDILYQDSSLIIVAKPSGLLVHRSKQASDRETCLSILRDQVGQWVYPAHRLDRGTSGALIFSLEPAIARTISEAFVERTVRKEYLAVVRGWAPESGETDRPLADEITGRIFPARTIFHRLEQTELPYAVGRYETARFSLIRAEPATGRTHQIRRHMAQLRHPVIGDTTHGDGKQNRFFREHFELSRLLLHASSLSLPHPVTGEIITITAPLPEELRRLFEELGWG